MKNHSQEIRSQRSEVRRSLFLFLILVLIVGCRPAEAQKLTDLPVITSLASTDRFVVLDVSETLKASTITYANAFAAYQPLDASLTAHAALTTAANKGIYYSGADTPVTFDLSSFGRTLGGYANEAAFKAGVNLEAGTDFNAYRAEVDKLGLKGSDIASTASIDIGASAGEFIDITGTTAITALGTATAGTRRILRFNGALTFTHNATSLILPGAANITTANGDTATMVSLGSGNWKCVTYEQTLALPVLLAGNQTIAGTKTFSGALTLTGGITLPLQADTGGDARGTGAVDLQGTRAAAAQVASGNYSLVAGGRNNKASGADSVAAGNTNTASGVASTAFGGGHTVSGDYSAAMGYGNTITTSYGTAIGFGNTVSASGGVGLGVGNSVSGTNGVAVGGANSVTSSSAFAYGVQAKARLYCMEAQAAGQLAAVGDAQFTRTIMRVNTTGATGTRLLVNSGDFTIPSNATIGARVAICGRKQSGGASSAFYGVRQVVIANTAGTTALQGAVGTVGTDIDTLTIGGIAITADDTNDAMAITVTGVAATNIAWVATIEAIEITY